MNALARLPTYSVDDEQAVLGALLTDNRLLSRMSGLSEADFYSPRNAAAFAAITRIIASGGVADVLTVRDALATGDTGTDSELGVYLVRLVDAVPSLSNAWAYAAAVWKHAQRRALIAAADATLAEAWTTADAATVIDAATSRFGALARGAANNGPMPIAEIVTERLEHYAALEAGTVAPGWSTGIPLLDRLLNGGVRAGNLYVPAARPSGGKSSFAAAVGLALARAGLPVAFLSMEMSRQEVTDRCIANIGRVSLDAIANRNMSSDDWSRATEAADALARLPFHIDDQPALTLSEIRTKAKSVKGLKVLIVDYLQLCGSTRAGRRDSNRNAEIEEITRGLKALAKELQCAVIALSQLNRDVEKRAVPRPNLSDLRDSGAIEQDADVVMFMWAVRTLPAEGIRIIGLGIDKNRQGRRGEIGLDFYGDTQSWAQSAADIRNTPAARGNGGDL